MRSHRRWDACIKTGKVSVSCSTDGGDACLLMSYFHIVDSMQGIWRHAMNGLAGIHCLCSPTELTEKGLQASMTAKMLLLYCRCKTRLPHIATALCA